MGATFDKLTVGWMVDEAKGETVMDRLIYHRVDLEKTIRDLIGPEYDPREDFVNLEIPIDIETINLAMYRKMNKRSDFYEAHDTTVCLLNALQYIVKWEVNEITEKLFKHINEGKEFVRDLSFKTTKRTIRDLEVESVLELALNPSHSVLGVKLTYDPKINRINVVDYGVLGNVKNDVCYLDLTNIEVVDLKTNIVDIVQDFIEHYYLTVQMCEADIIR